MYQYTLLFIDDEQSILRALQRLFRDESFLVLSADNASRGLEILEEMAVDLIICDHRMPGMSGLDFFKIVAEKHPDTIKILLTGFADLNMALEAINSCNLYRFILKPWNNDELRMTVRRALEHLDLLRSNADMTARLQRVELTLQKIEEKYPGVTRMPQDGIYRVQA